MNKITPFLWFNNNAEDATEWVSSWHSLRTAGWS
jgi:predicted 3-demethylubiquinone-9 3-methyltransferase (glyoxalase superfamily)